MRRGNYSEMKLNKRIYKSLKRFLKNKIPNLYERKIFIGENSKTIFFVIPLRDIIKEDITLVFEKNKFATCFRI